jgi:hypothetical protein
VGGERKKREGADADAEAAARDGRIEEAKLEVFGGSGRQ